MSSFDSQMVLLSFVSGINTYLKRQPFSSNALYSSKAALNQIIRTLQHELSRRSPQHPALCIAYHPGTMLTELSEPYTSGQSVGKTKGLFHADEAASNLLRLLSGLDEEKGGSFYAYDGSRVPW